jgi:hypothetical protein
LARTDKPGIPSGIRISTAARFLDTGAVGGAQMRSALTMVHWDVNR